MRTLFPEINCYNSQFLQVSTLHRLYVEESGNPNGTPVLFLHGGPGSGTSKKHRRYFDPNHYRIILFDQRGAGQSTPHAEIIDNTTWDLVEDIEKIRNHLGIEKWMVFGGSWGSTLGLVYAETHPSRVLALIVRGIFLCRSEEINWFYQKGCDFLFPDLWEKYVNVIPRAERSHMIKAYYKRLTSENGEIRKTAARAWSEWEGATLKLISDPEVISAFGEDNAAAARARLECHYFFNNCFFKNENQIIEDVQKIRHIPAMIIHGRYDVVCPFKNAWDLSRAWPEAELEVIKDAGHAADEPGTTDALIRATEKFKLLLNQ